MDFSLFNLSGLFIIIQRQRGAHTLSSVHLWNERCFIFDAAFYSIAYLAVALFVYHFSHSRSFFHSFVSHLLYLLKLMPKRNNFLWDGAPKMEQQKISGKQELKKKNNKKKNTEKLASKHRCPYRLPLRRQSWGFALHLLHQHLFTVCLFSAESAAPFYFISFIIALTYIFIPNTTNKYVHGIAVPILV